MLKAKPKTKPKPELTRAKKRQIKKLAKAAVKVNKSLKKVKKTRVPVYGKPTNQWRSNCRITHVKTVNNHHTYQIRQYAPQKKHVTWYNEGRFTTILLHLPYTVYIHCPTMYVFYACFSFKSIKNLEQDISLIPFNGCFTGAPIEGSIEEIINWYWSSPFSDIYEPLTGVIDKWKGLTDKEVMQDKMGLQKEFKRNVMALGKLFNSHPSLTSF